MTSNTPFTRGRCRLHPGKRECSCSLQGQLAPGAQEGQPGSPPWLGQVPRFRGTASQPAILGPPADPKPAQATLLAQSWPRRCQKKACSTAPHQVSSRPGCTPMARSCCLTEASASASCLSNTASAALASCGQQWREGGVEGAGSARAWMSDEGAGARTPPPPTHPPPGSRGPAASAPRYAPPAAPPPAGGRRTGTCCWRSHGTVRPAHAIGGREGYGSGRDPTGGRLTWQPCQEGGEGPAGELRHGRQGHRLGAYGHMRSEQLAPAAHHASAAPCGCQLCTRAGSGGRVTQQRRRQHGRQRQQQQLRQQGPTTLGGQQGQVFLAVWRWILCLRPPSWPHCLQPVQWDRDSSSMLGGAASSASSRSTARLSSASPPSRCRAIARPPTAPEGVRGGGGSGQGHSVMSQPASCLWHCLPPAHDRRKAAGPAGQQTAFSGSGPWVAQGRRQPGQR